MNRKGRTLWRESRNGDEARRWALLLALGLLALLALTGEAGQAQLRYERAALLNGDWWRLVTAHLVHLGPRHLVFNLVGLALLGLLFGREYSLERWLSIVLLAMATVDAGLWFLRPQVAWYAGASGVLHGIWAAGACAQLRRSRWLSALPLAALIVKIGYEQWRGISAVLGDLPVVVDAHWFGALGGALVALPLALRRKWL
jgi:rhomboid family GlyGly-CTERM serine protease